MSDGMSDANAVNRLAVNVEAAAYDLRDALKACEEGYRGLTPGGYLVNVNDILKAAGYEIRKLPGR